MTECEKIKCDDCKFVEDCVDYGWEVCKKFTQKASEPQTNEEWFDSLTTNEKAYHLSDICAWAMEEFRCGNTEKANITYWEMWLKQPHQGE